MIAFNTIPINILTPGQFIEFDNSRAVQGLPVVPHRILVIAPRLSTGTVAALTPTPVRSALEGEAFCGRGSLGAAMIAFAKRANPFTEMHMIGVADNGSGVAATGTLTVTGPSTAAGVLNIYVAGQRVQVAVANGDAQNAIATAINAAVNQDTSLPVTSGVSTNVVTLTARNKGTTGNDIDVRLNYNFGDSTPAGVAVAIVAMASGATNPDLATVTAAIGDTHYHTIILPWTDSANLTVIESFLLDRWGGMVQKEGHVYAGVAGTHSAIATVGAARNSQFLTLMGTQKSPHPPWLFAASVGAIDAGQCENPSDTNRPRQTLVLPDILPPRLQDRYTRTERNTHLAPPNGVATFDVDGGGLVRIERLVTTYKTANSVPDVSYQDVETLRALAYLRFSTRARIALRFPRHKLASDGTPIPPGEPIVTPRAIRDELITLFIAWQGAGLVEGLEQFKRDLLVERNQSDVNRVDAIIPPDVINGFRVFAAQIQFRL